LSAIFSGDVTLQGLVSEFLRYKPLTPQQSPIVAIQTRGRERKPLTRMGNQTRFQFWVHVMVKLAPISLTEEECEDLLDDVEQRVSDLLLANRGETADWKTLEYGEATNVVYFKLEGGAVYLQESIPVDVVIFS
jgi:hypothetical protein